ncbi:MAG TPA: sigma-54 dependent transcriptional regulator [Porticoccaceae bacterium]|nr:sigma-54 dependent transcriptional regulator [Porticoccaceae bacterium]
MREDFVLVVEDDASLREALCDTLELAGFPTHAAADGSTALAVLAEHGHRIRLVVSDVQMAPMPGDELLAQLQSLRPELPVVLMTAYGTIEQAVRTMRRGAVDYLVKPFAAPALVELVRRLLPEPAAVATGLVAQAEASRRLLALAERVAKADVTVLICGESGVGKEVYARHIHRCSTRADGPFVAINCAAIPENMLEAVLFGHEKGAFTGAVQASPGKFEQANGGTLLLDEISEMALGLQAKLLRVLQEREVERLGGRKTLPLDVRVLATTNRDLRGEVAAGRFREDLFYRLSVFPLQLSPLRERPEDILPLARLALARHRSGAGPAPELTSAACARLLAHDWPGNVRELDNVIQRALVVCDGTIIAADDIDVAGLPTASAAASAIPPARGGESGDELRDELRDHEHSLILDTLKAVSGNRKDAAERLGISPRTLRYKLARMREAGVPSLV